MPPALSAGLLMYRLRDREVEVFLAHPGGPLFAGRDDGSWTVPKGLPEPGEAPLAAARREFAEETGRTVEACGGGDPFLPLGSIVQRGGKRVVAWAFAGDWPDGVAVASNTFPLEWPPRSGRTIDVPEIDRAAFFPIERARGKINPAQRPLLDRLLSALEA